MARLIAPIVLVVVLALVMGEARGRKAPERESRNLLKEEDNEIDHGSSNSVKDTIRGKQQLLGYWGEHQVVGKKDKKRRKNKLKSRRPSLNREDIHLQDLEYLEQRPQERRKGKKPKDGQKKLKKQGQQQDLDKYLQRKELKKELKAEVQRALDKGMSPEKLLEQLAAESKYPKKMYSKVVEKLSRKAKYSASAINNPVP